MAFESFGGGGGGRTRYMGSDDKKSMNNYYNLHGNDEIQRNKEKSYTIPVNLGKFFTDNVYLADAWHNEPYLLSPGAGNNDDDNIRGISGSVTRTWRLKERMKTAGVALVVCLNIGIDPPDVVKPNPCARKECWFDPTGPNKQKGLEYIGNALQQQYEKWQSKAKYKQCLDPTSEDLRRVCINLRKTAKSDRLLLHYNGHGVPRPTVNGELWVFGKHYTHYMPIAVSELRNCLGDPAIYVLDCSGAGALLPFFIDQPLSPASSPDRPSSRKTFDDSDTKNNAARNMQFIQSSIDGPIIVLAACRANENLPLSPQCPADIFTACLTTPVVIALRWFILQNPFSMADVNPDLAENIPGKENDRKTPRGELNWIFTAITDTIAWDTLPSNAFQKMFRQDLLVASLFRNFLLAKRIMKSFNCTPQSWPPLPDSSTHTLWQSWDLAVESCFCNVINLQKGGIMVEAKNNVYSNSLFFRDHLTAFEIWLNFYGGKSARNFNIPNPSYTNTGSNAPAYITHKETIPPPSYLPILLQVLLSQTHRLRALLLLQRYLALGPEAVNFALLVGIFPYILKLLQSPAAEIRNVLVGIWGSILGFDPSVRQELIRDKSHSYFVSFLLSRENQPVHRCMSAFILAEVCNSYREGQQTCLQQGLHRSCSSILVHTDVLACSGLKKWIALCLYKLCEDFLWAKYLCLTEGTQAYLYPLLLDPDVTVRASAVLAIGEMFGASVLSSKSSNPLRTSSAGSSGDISPMSYATESKMNESVTPVLTIEQYALLSSELQLALQILDSCTDGSVLVRREAVIALTKVLKSWLKKFDTTVPVSESNSNGNSASNNKRNTANESDSGSKLNTSTSSSPNKAEFYRAASVSPSILSSIGVTAYPWVLPPELSKFVTNKVQLYLEKVGFDSGELSDTVSASIIECSKDDQMPPPPLSKSDQSQCDTPKSAIMATAYVRLWLALFEVHYKDPHIIVARAAASISKRIYDQLRSQNVTHASDIQRNLSLIPPLPPSLDSVSNNTVIPPLSPLGTHFLPINRPRNLLLVHLIKSLGVGNAVMNRNRIMNAGKPIPSPFFPETGGLGGTGLLPVSNSIDNLYLMTDNALEKSILEMANDPLLISHLYDWSKQLFLIPDDGFDAYSDDMSEEGNNRLYRDKKLQEVLKIDRQLATVFKEVDDRQDHILDRKAKDEISVTKASIVATLPQAYTKFEQKTILNIENSETTLVLFHAFQDILSVTDGHKVSIWSLANGSKVLEINTKLDSLGIKTSRSNTVVSPPASSTKRTPSPSPTVSYMSNNAARITAMSWINESYDSLLMIGSDDGSVKVFKDASNSDMLNPDSAATPNVTLATAFVALPDVAETSRGSGMVFSYLQHTGNLIVGGNSSSIRVWDLAREQCVRAFATGLDTCTTALASQSVYSSNGNGNSSNCAPSTGPGSLLSWTFAGFADGSIGIFDERVGSIGGQVHQVRDTKDGSWIISAHLRADVPEVITGSVKGIVKFWDIRSMRPFKTFEVFKSALTALTVHNCAPIMATGSNAQFIKIITFGGDQLGNIIKYHDGFLGQRIGPVSCLSFHPYKTMLAAGATDSIVSIYATTNDSGD